MMQDKDSKLKQLRRQAEQSLHEMTHMPNIKAETIDELLHELHVYHAELEIQLEDLKQAYEQVAKLQKRYADLFNYAPVGYVVTDQNDKVVDANLTASILFGLQPADWLNRALVECIKMEDRDTYHIHRRTVLRTGEQQDCEVRVHGADETIFYARLITLKFDDGTLRTAIIDISDAKKTHEALERTLEHEKQLNRVRNRVLSVVAHDFRTPLATILSSVDLLKDYGDRLSDDKKHKRYQTIHNLAWYLNDQVQEISLARQFDQQAPQTKLQTFELPPFAQQVIDDLATITNQQNVVLNVNTSGDPTVRWDQTLLRRIIMNLIGNALKYSDDDVTCTIDMMDDTVRFQIADRGIGIPQDEQQYIYETFYRGENAQNIPGTGIGLYIVEQAVKAHQGKIECASRIDEGTIFTVTLPRYSEPSSRQF